MSSEIGSREQLMIDLTLALAPGSRERLLTVVRLHGLQTLAGRAGAGARDELIERAHRLTLLEVRACGRFYLPRRDELCVLFDSQLDEAIRVLDRITTALNELDPVGDVTAEAGVALLPEEASHPIGALDRADRRILPGDYAGREQWLGTRRGRREEHRQEPTDEDPEQQEPEQQEQEQQLHLPG
jgi:GGDEF domain-containing protein